MSKTAKIGLDGLLRPDDSILVLIDHQPYQFANMHSHEPTMIINNVIALAKTAKVFNVPTVLSTVIEERGGYLVKGLQDVFPEQKPINRTFINAWEDPNVTNAVKKSGRKRSCWPRATRDLPSDAGGQALGEGYDVFIVTDASGGVTAGPTIWRATLVSRRYRHLARRAGRMAARLGARENRRWSWRRRS
jgi:nicotinamidase-related amidase